MVSIIIASYNKSAFIGDTINSVLSQTYREFELIIVDDHSNDDTKQILSNLKDPRVKIFLNDQNNGANYCRNVGLRNSCGEYVVFMDADDLLVESCLEERIRVLKNSSDVDAAIFSMGVFNKKIGDNSSIWQPTCKDPLADILSHDIPWSIMQPIWKRDFVQRLNGFDESFKRLQDVEFHTRALFEDRFQFICISGRPDCYYRIDPERSSGDSFTFLQKIVASGINYCNKFLLAARKRNLEKKLAGTFHKLYLRLLQEYRAKNISAHQFAELEELLLNSESFPFLKGSVGILFRFTRFFNLLPFRISGVNFLIRKFLY